MSDLDGLYEDDEEDCDLRKAIDLEDQLEDSVLNMDTYNIDIRNINLYSLDTSSRKGFKFTALPRAEEFYSCKDNAIPIIYDTAIRLEITRNIETTYTNEIKSDKLNVTGSVVKPLRLSIKRQQYEQLLETMDNLFKVPKDLIRPPGDYSPCDGKTMREEAEDDIDLHTFHENDNIRRRLFHQESIEERKTVINPCSKYF